MNLKLSEWANIAEVLSAIAIVVSLVFVGLQIGAGNRETRAATIQAALDSEMAFQAEILRYADTWEKVASGKPLADEVETRRGIILFNMLMTTNENSWFQMQSGYLAFSAEAVAVGVTWPIYETWQTSGGYRARTPEFRAFLESERQRRNVE